jgi:hypothetical protein
MPFRPDGLAIRPTDLRKKTRIRTLVAQIRKKLGPIRREGSMRSFFEKGSTISTGLESDAATCAHGAHLCLTARRWSPCLPSLQVDACGLSLNDFVADSGFDFTFDDKLCDHVRSRVTRAHLVVVAQADHLVCGCCNAARYPTNPKRREVTIHGARTTDDFCP